jgi:hypothetical protein
LFAQRLEPIPYPGIGKDVLQIFAWLNFVAQLVGKDRADIPAAERSRHPTSQQHAI